MVFNSFDKNIFSILLNLRYKYNFNILSLSATVPMSENKVGISKEIFLIGLPIMNCLFFVKIDAQKQVFVISMLYNQDVF